LENWQDRKQNLFEICKKLFEDFTHNNNLIFIIDNPEDLYYYSRYWGEGILIITQDKASKLIVPKLEYFRATETSIDCDIIQSERGKSLTESVVNLLGTEVLVFYGGTDFWIIDEISRKIGKSKLKLNPEALRQVRQIKEPVEIERIQKASNIIDRLYKVARNEIKVNISEEEIQSTLVYEAMRLGARFPTYQFTSNPLIVASGPNGSFPHAETSSRKIQDGDLIVLDITLSYNHYISDATRTFGIGNVSPEKKEVYDIVYQAQLQGIGKIATSTDFSEIDAACRNLIKEAGYGEKFIHSTGHGIGLEVHELPWIRPNFKSKISENMTITIEPGIYISNKFGVRIEDSLLIKSVSDSKKGFEFLNFHSYDKELIIL
jgi:Xaa-Pro aminopeptidase/Xaa-Pro dipeptidase